MDVDINIFTFYVSHDILLDLHSHSLYRTYELDTFRNISISNRPGKIRKENTAEIRLVRLCY